VTLTFSTKLIHVVEAFVITLKLWVLVVVFKLS